MEHFPAEINKVSYDMLLRIPGGGVRGAGRIVKARRERSLRFEDLKRLNITMKRAKYFITCNGTFANGVLFDPISIQAELTKQTKKRRSKGMLEGQLGLFEQEVERQPLKLPVFWQNYTAGNSLQSSTKNPKKSDTHEFACV
jgi:predicted DNA-binding helix-hairpin-helix protein